MDDLKKFSQAVLAGIQGSQGGAGIAGISDVVNNAFGSRVRAPIVNKAGGQGQLAGVVADNEERQAEAARKQKLAEIEAMLDPSKYQRVRKEDGGFAFFDPTGKEIGIDTYAKRTGLRPADILKDSDNPIDRQFVNDFANMNELMTASFNNDTETVKRILKENNLDEGLKPQSFASQLIAKYPHIYGKGSYQTTYGNLNKPIFAVKPQSSAGSLEELMAMYR